MNTIISESSLTIQSLHNLLNTAFIENTVDADGDLLVFTERRIKIFISLNEHNKLIKFISFFSLKEESPDYQKSQLCNRMNNNFIFARFSIERADTLVADYHLPYGQGVLPYQIINSLKLMDRIVVAAIKEEDTDDLVG